MDKIPLKVAHYGRFDPRVTTGGVETFARNLETVFEEVIYLAPGVGDMAAAVRDRVPVICDNQMVVDWPKNHPVIGFQHGVAKVKAQLTGTRTDRRLARQQAKAAKRPRTLWVACARWISRTFDQLYENPAHHVIYHQVEVDRFDGNLANEDSNLLLHDGRAEHKGRDLFPILIDAFPQWRFEGLNCAPNEVPDRMRQGRAFLHLSRYEGNSIVCNEAMAMDLPCLFTRVGLMQDDEDLDVYVVPPEDVYGKKDLLIQSVGAFLEALSSRDWNPRRWSMENATPAVHRDGWRKVMMDFQRMSEWDLGLENEAN